MCQCQQSELGFNLFHSAKLEPLEALVAFQVPEGGLHVLRSLTPMAEPFLGHQLFPFPIPEPVQIVVHFDDPVPLGLVATAPERATLAVLGLIPADGLLKSVGGLLLPVLNMLHGLTRWADETVPLWFVAEVGGSERILLPVVGLFLVEVVVLDEGLHAFFLCVHVVFLAPVSGVRHGRGRIGPVHFPERVHVLLVGAGIGGRLMDRVVGDELPVGGYLHVVGRLELAVEHVVLLHAHEGGVPVRLGVAVPPVQYLLLLVVPLQGLGPVLLGIAELLDDFLVGLRSINRPLNAFDQLDHLLGRDVLIGDGGRIHQLLLGHALGIRPEFVDLVGYPSDACLHGLAPDEGVAVGGRLDLGPVRIDGVQAYQLFLDHELHDLGKDVAQGILQMAAPEPVDRIVVRAVHADEPHEADVVPAELLDAAAGVDVAHVGVDQQLEHHPRMVGRTASAGICFQKRIQVNRLDDAVDDAHRILLFNKITQSRRQ